MLPKPGRPRGPGGRFLLMRALPTTCSDSFIPTSRQNIVYIGTMCVIMSRNMANGFDEPVYQRTASDIRHSPKVYHGVTYDGWERRPQAQELQISNQTLVPLSFIRDIAWSFYHGGLQHTGGIYERSTFSWRCDTHFVTCDVTCDMWRARHRRALQDLPGSTISFRSVSYFPYVLVSPCFYGP